MSAAAAKKAELSRNQTVKQQRVEVLSDDLKDAELVVVTQNTGLNADETLDLRRKSFAAQVGYKVGKNTLIGRAIKGTRIEALEQFLKGPTALAYSKDPIAAAKIVAEFAKKNDKLKIIGAVMQGQVLDAAQTKELASLPSLDELRAKLLGLLMAPATKIAGVLQAPAGQLARVMAARGRQES